MKKFFFIAFGLLLALGSISAIGLAAFEFLNGGRDMLDRARVVEVKPSPDGRKAAVVYVYDHADSSGTTVRVALSGPPFPVLGQDFTSKHTIAAVHGGGSDERAKAAIQIAWHPNGKLSICAASGNLILFSADGEHGDFAGAFQNNELAQFSFCDASPPAIGSNPLTPP
jgi:hypothetical protein